MTKVVVYTFLTTAFIIFFIFSPSNQHGLADHERRNISHRRFGFDLPKPDFDPLVAKMKRIVEEDKNEDGDEVDEYFMEQGRLNVTLRLIVLFPLVDISPKDASIDYNELEAWNSQQVIERLHHKTKLELLSFDKNRDGEISFQEFLPQQIEENGMKHGEAGWWKEQFDNADVDKNGTLDLNDLLNPEDCNNKATKLWILREKVKNKDVDGDGMINYKEFLENIYGTYKGCVLLLKGINANVTSPDDKFDELDVNKDGYLEVEELLPLFGCLRPGDLTYANYFTSYLMMEADDNGDGKLSLAEVINHKEIFYSTVYDEDEDEDDFHDEL